MMIETPEYEKDEVPEVEEMQCPEEQKLTCADYFDRRHLLAHYITEHPEYGATDMEAIEVIFEQERSRRYGR